MRVRLAMVNSVSDALGLMLFVHAGWGHHTGGISVLDPHKRFLRLVVTQLTDFAQLLELRNHDRVMVGVVGHLHDVALGNFPQQRVTLCVVLLI